MSSTWYKINDYWGPDDSPVVAVAVHRETPKMLILEEFRYGAKRVKTAKTSSWDRYFSTFDEAVEHLRNRYEQRQQSGKEALERATDIRNKFEKWASTAIPPQQEQKQ